MVLVIIFFSLLKLFALITLQPKVIKYMERLGNSDNINRLAE